MKLNTLIATLALVGSAAQAQTVEVQDAWARATVPGQKATGAFMKITAKEDAKLVGVSSPVAGVTEVHEMKMENNVMRMRAVPALDLPAGKTVEFKPGGYHVMLLDLKAALPKDSTVPLTLIFKNATGAESRVELKLPVGTAAPGAAAAAADKAGMTGHGHGMKH